MMDRENIGIPYCKEIHLIRKFLFFNTILYVRINITEPNFLRKFFQEVKLKLSILFINRKYTKF